MGCAKNLDLTFVCSPKFKDKIFKEVKMLITGKEGLGVGIFRVCGWMQLHWLPTDEVGPNSKYSTIFIIYQMMNMQAVLGAIVHIV